MNDFTESGLHFNFDKQWVVKKYDAHKFFASLAGEGFKGVDFIAINDCQLLLMEIKNYRRRQSWQTENPFQAVIDQPDEFVVDMAYKAEDTLKALEIIRKYYLRKRWYRFFKRLQSFIPFPNLDWLFWTRAYLLARERKNVCFILWLETENGQQQLRGQLQKQLSLKLQPFTDKAYIANCDNHPLQESVLVENLTK